MRSEERIRKDFRIIIMLMERSRMRLEEDPGDWCTKMQVKDDLKLKVSIEKELNICLNRKSKALSIN